MVVAVAPLVQNTNNRQIHLSSDGLHIDLHLTLTLGITAQQAKRKLSRFLLDEVSLFLGPEAPLLVLSDTSSALGWTTRQYGSTILPLTKHHNTV